MKKSACRNLVAGVAVALVICVAPSMLVAQEPEQQDKSEATNTELFELRRTLLERIENAVTRGDVSALRRMAGIEPPVERDYEALLEEASALQEEFKDIRLPTAMEQRQARDDLYEMVGEVDDRLAHVIYQAAKYAVEEDRRAMEELQALGERIEENRKKRQARGRDLAKASMSRCRNLVVSVSYGRIGLPVVMCE